MSGKDCYIRLKNLSLTDILTLTGVSKKYPVTPNKWAVEDVNLGVHQGEFFCLIGPSGCGKSTVLKMIAGLEETSAGTINKPENMAMVFQLGALFPWLTAEENVAFGLKMRGTSKQQTVESVSKYLEMVGLGELKGKYPRELSGGQRQRVGIARALAVSPEVLLLDEPFSALDFLMTEELHKDLLRIWKETGVTIVMVSHLVEEAVVLADRIAEMKDGKLKGIIDVSLPRPRDELSKNFIETVAKAKKTLH